MRRILAVVLPQLACEIARYRSMGTGPVGPGGLRSGPVAVIIDREGATPSPSTATIDEVSDEAKRYGVRPGQRAVEACALLSRLTVHHVTEADLEAELGRVAEVILAFAPTAAIRLETARGSTVGSAVWLDITGAAHLAGGEEALVDEIAERVAALGHRVRIAIAGGPRIAEALARFEVTQIHALPIQALPVDVATGSWFIRLGLFTLGDLAKLPRDELRQRLGPRAVEAIDLLEGRDDVPLLPFTPPRVIEEEMSFDDPVEGAEPLLFVLRGMTSRLAARLAARGEACSRLEVTIPIDRSIARLRRGNEANEEEGGEIEPLVSFAVDLPAPLGDANDLLRALRPRLERTDLPAPATGIRLAIPQIARARRVQLDLSRDKSVSPDNLPALLAELSAEIGADKLGVLEVVDAHRPEARSRLAPVDLDAPAPKRSFVGARDRAEEPTRLFDKPIPIGAADKGAVVAIDGRLYAVDGRRFTMRLAEVEWWTSTPSSRDYARVLLSPGPKSRDAALEAFVFVDRATGEAFLQGFYE